MPDSKPTLPPRKAFENHWFARYFLALLAVAAGFLLRAGLTRMAGGDLPTYITFYPVVMLSALVGGVGPGILATVAAALGVDYFVLFPTGSFAVAGLADAIGLAFFTGMGVFMSVVAELYRRARQQAAEYETKAYARDGLEAPARWSRQGWLLNAGLAASLAILAAAGWQSVRNARAAEQAGKRVTHTRVVIEELDRMLSALTDAETAQRDFLLTGDEKYLEPYPSALAQVQTNMAGLKQLTLDNPSQQKRLAGMETRIADREALLRQTIELRRSQGLPAAVERVAAGQGISIMDQIRKLVADAKEEENGLLEQRAAAQTADTGKTLQALLAGSVLGFLLLITVFFFLKQENNRRAKAEADARLHRDHLQEIVAARTAELGRSNEQLKMEIKGHQEAEEALVQQSEWLRVTLASIGDAVLATDTAGRITFLNPVAESLTGWRQSEALGGRAENVFRIINEQTRAPGEEIVGRVLREGRIVALANHTALLSRDGREVPIEDSAAPIRDSSGAISGVVLVFHDVTERRRAQEAMRESQRQNEFLAGIIERSSQPFGVGYPDGRLGLVNKAFEQLTGYSRDELHSINWSQALTPPEWRELERPKLEELARSGNPVRYQKEYARKDGSRVPIELLVGVERDVEAKPLFYYSFLTDISERKRAEEATRAARDRFYLALSSMTSATLLVNEDDRIEFANQAFCDMFGLKETPADLQAMTSSEMLEKITPAYLNPEKDLGRVKELVQRGLLVQDEEVTMAGERTFLRDFIPLRLGDNPNGRLWVQKDITDRKRAQETLRKAEERYHTLFDTLIEGFCIIEVIFDAQDKPVDYRFLEINPAFEKQTGLRNAQGKLMRDLAPDHEAHWFEVYGKVALTGEPARFVNEARALDRWFDVSAYRVGGPESRKVAILFNDITQTKRAEAARAQLASIVESSEDGILSKGLDGTITSWNAAAGRLFGYGADEAIGRPIGLLLPPDRQDEEAAIMARLEAGERVDHFETVRVAKDGRRLDVSVTISPLKDGGGRIIGASKIVRDITERKQKEVQLRLLSAAVESAANGIAVTDRTGRILWINPAFAQMTGYKRAEAVGQNPRILKSGRHSPEFYRQMWSVLLKGESWHGELVNRRKDGSLYPEEMTIAPVQVDGAQVTHYVAIKQDITARRRAERRTELLADTASRLLNSDDPQRVVDTLCREVLEFLDCQVFFNFLVDDQQHRLHLNACGGIPKADAAKIEWLDFGVAVCGCAARDRCRIVARNIQETPDPRTGLVKPYGIEAYACHPLMAAERLLGTLSFGTRARKDFTEEELSFMKAVADQVANAIERKRTQAALQSTAEEAKRSNRDLEQFAYIASHDLQEPLRAVGGYVKLLQRRFPQNVDPKALEFINGAVEGADRMERLISDLLEFSRVGAHGGAFSPADLNAVLNEALRNLHTSIESAGAKVTRDALPTLMVDATQVMQIFQNLIGNAIKFRSERPPEIHVGAQSEPGRWVFSVRDNGIGIEPRYFERIFQIFQRLHTRQHYPGTGIGLAICKKMVERHDGAIWVESQPGHGSIFYFSIPETFATIQRDV